MNVVSITGERQCAIIDRPVPRSAGEMVVVRVLAAPLCTEYKAYAAGHCTDSPGHEAAGEVVEVAQSGKVKVGDRVVVMPQYPCGRCPLCLSGDFIHCQDGIDPLRATGSESGTATCAQYLLKQDWMLVPIPDDIPTELAAMACCGLGPTFGALQTMKLQAPGILLITGMGPVGLGGVVNGVLRGLRVIAVESQPYRAALARELGAELIISPQDPDAVTRIREFGGGRGADAGIDCSGSAAGQRLLIDAVRRRGRVAFVGEAADLTIHVSSDMIRKGLTLHGQWHYNLGDSPRLMRTIRAARPSLEKLITHRFPMSRVQEAFDLQLTGNCGKVILDPWR